MSQNPNSKDPSESPAPDGDGVSSEYHKQTGSESGESANISRQNDLLKNAAKANKISEANDTIHQNLGDVKKGYSTLGDAPNPDVTVQWVLREAYLQTQEDLKEYAGKIKPGNETDRSSEDTQGEGLTAQLLARVNHFGIKIGLSKRGTFLGVLLVTMIIGALAVSGLVLLAPKNESPTPGLVEANQPVNNPLELALIPTATPTCSINFTAPTNVTELPDFGPVLFEWNSIPAPSAYSLEIDPPNGSAWLISLKGTSKTIYMENFLEGGEYTASVHAIGADGEVLCTAIFTFSKSAYASSAKDKDNSSGTEPCVSTGMFDQCP